MSTPKPWVASSTAAEHFAVLLQNLDALEHGRVDPAGFSERNAGAWRAIARDGNAAEVLTIWRGWHRAGGAATSDIDGAPKAALVVRPPVPRR